MPFLALLFILFFGIVLFAIGYYIVRNQYPRLARAFVFMGFAVGLFLFGLWLVESSGWQRKGLYKQLMHGLESAELQDFLLSHDDLDEQHLFMLSQASTALRLIYQEEADSMERVRILSALEQMAEFTASSAKFPVWNRKGEWGQQLYFLTRAGIILANYQLATGDDKYQSQLGQLATFVSAGIRRSQYKHLASRPSDMALRPHDNVAALYTLMLTDKATGASLMPPTAEDWVYYIRRELQHEDTKLPCAGFTATNRCRLLPVGSSLAMLSTYASACKLDNSRELWREFRHYYKQTYLKLFAWIPVAPTFKGLPEFCDFSISPLTCERYENVMALQAAAVRREFISYYQINNTLIMMDLFNPPNEIWQKAPQEQLNGMISIATRLSAAYQARAEVQ